METEIVRSNISSNRESVRWRTISSGKSKGYALYVINISVSRDGNFTQDCDYDYIIMASFYDELRCLRRSKDKCNNVLCGEKKGHSLGIREFAGDFLVGYCVDCPPNSVPGNTLLQTSFCLLPSQVASNCPYSASQVLSSHTYRPLTSTEPTVCTHPSNQHKVM